MKPIPVLGEQKTKPLNLELQNVQLKSTEKPSLPEVKNTWSDLLDRDERTKALNAGHSMDSKKVAETLGYVDMKQICVCLANALLKHVEYGKGFLFQTDLLKYLEHVKDEKIDDEPVNANSELNFTYDLGQM